MDVASSQHALTISTSLGNRARWIARVRAVHRLERTAVVEPVSNCICYSLQQREGSPCNINMRLPKLICEGNWRMQECVYFATKHRRSGCEPSLLYLGLAVHEAWVYKQPSGGRVPLFLQCFQEVVSESCDSTVCLDEYTKKFHSWPVSKIR
jgi:hypothetical protein